MKFNQNLLIEELYKILVLKMGLKKLFQILLFLIIVFSFFNIVHADSGPTIGANQAQKIAQFYLKSQDLPYTALTPGWDAWKSKVKDTKTGGVKWIPVSEAKADSPDFGGPGRYQWVEGYNTTWVVQVENQNGKNVGRIYVDAETGRILKAILDKNISKEDTFETNNTTSNTNMTATQDQGILNSIIDGIMSFFQQIWTAIFGS